MRTQSNEDKVNENSKISQCQFITQKNSNKWQNIAVKHRHHWDKHKLKRNKINDEYPYINLNK